MSISSSLRSTLSPDIGIDLGTANTVVYEREAGIIVSEPSVVAFRRSDRSVVAVGATAAPPTASTSSGRCAVGPFPISKVRTR